MGPDRFEGGFCGNQGLISAVLVQIHHGLSQEMTTIQAALAANDSLKVEHSLHALKGFKKMKWVIGKP